MHVLPRMMLIFYWYPLTQKRLQKYRQWLVCNLCWGGRRCSIILTIVKRCKELLTWAQVIQLQISPPASRVMACRLAYPFLPIASGKIFFFELWVLSKFSIPRKSFQRLLERMHTGQLSKRILSEKNFQAWFRVISTQLLHSFSLASLTRINNVYT